MLLLIHSQGTKTDVPSEIGIPIQELGFTVVLIDSIVGAKIKYSTTVNSSGMRVTTGPSMYW